MNEDIQQILNICRAYYNNRGLSLNATSALTNLFGAQYAQEYTVINPGNDFHLSFDRSHARNGHLTCMMPNGEYAHIGLSATPLQITTWFNACCDQSNRSKDNKFMRAVLNRMRAGTLCS